MQKDFDLVWCRGMIREKIFEPWMVSLRTKGCEFLEGKSVTDLFFDEETACISEVLCGSESYEADAVIFAVGISKVQQMVKDRCACCFKCPLV